METSTIQLRKILSTTTNNQESIQKSASAMMKYYDKAATLAVSEWRNTLQSLDDKSNLLTLLYVANEVLQTSKRNRGAKFLEAFSPVLKSSLVYICEQDRSVVEKVRRTAKIWGDRRVFSVRFVGDLLQGLNVFRDSSTPVVSSNEEAKQRISIKKKRTVSNLSSPSSHLSSTSPFEDEFSGDSSTTTPRPSTLQLNVNLDQVLHAASKSNEKEEKVEDQSLGNKRRRSNSPSSPEQQLPTAPQAKVLNTDTLLTLLQNLDTLTSQYQKSKKTISSIPPSHFSPTLDNSIVGDELSTMYTSILQTESLLKSQLVNLHTIANTTHSCENEIQRYIPYLQLSIQNDKQDLALCDTLLNKQFPALKMIYEPAKEIRDNQRKIEEKKMQEEEEQLKKKLKEEERKQSLKEILVGEGNVKPGMVWNSTMREYVNVHDPTSDSWRDH